MSEDCRVRLVIADTGPINYLILIGHIDVLPSLFHNVVLPAAVRAELDEAPVVAARLTAELLGLERSDLSCKLHALGIGPKEV